MHIGRMSDGPPAACGRTVSCWHHVRGQLARLTLSALLTIGLTAVGAGCSPPAAPAGHTPSPSQAPPPAATPGGTDPSEPTAVADDPVEPLTPEQVVERFYTWYIGYIHNEGDPIADRAYRSSEYVTQEIIDRVDEADVDRASADVDQHDPFLHAAVVPQEYTIEEALISGQEATVVVREMWDPGTRHELIQEIEVLLRLVDGWWKIANVTVAMTPEEVVEAFYWWYTGYPGDPTTEQIYQSSVYVTQEFSQKADEVITSPGQDAYDPFVCAQDMPKRFTVEEALVSPDEASVLVHTGLEEHEFSVQLRQVGGRWAISDVVCPWIRASEEQSTANWQTYVDEQYHFQIRFPETWIYEERSPVPPGTEPPEELEALKRLLIFEPQDWTGPEPPLYVQATRGTEEEFQRIYPPTAPSERLEINGHRAIKAVDDLGEGQLVRYTFQSPTDENIRIVIIDSISGFPGRIQDNADLDQASAEVVEVVQQILHTFEFEAW